MSGPDLCQHGNRGDRTCAQCAEERLPRPTRDPEARMSPCGAACSFGPTVIVYCAQGDHQNLGYHEGPLEAGSSWAVRWSPIGAQELEPRFVCGVAGRTGGHA